MLIDYYNLSHVVNGIGIINVLRWLGFKSIKDEFTAVRAECAVHGGDRKDSFCIYKNTLVWKCFSRKCEELHGESFFSLVAAIKNIDKKSAIDIFCSQFNVNRESFSDKYNDISDYKFRAYLNNYKLNNTENNVPINFPEIEGYTDYFLSDEGGPFSSATVGRFEIFSYYIDDKDKRKRVYIPIYDANNNLVFYSGRAVDKIVEDKYSNGTNFASGNILYNLNNARNTKSRYIIIVEGFKSVWRLYEYGYDNVVSSLGSYLKPGQLKLILPLLKDVVIFYDDDKAGKIGAKRVIDRYCNLVNIYNIDYDAGVDPADMSKNDIDALLTKFR